MEYSWSFTKNGDCFENLQSEKLGQNYGIHQTAKEDVTFCLRYLVIKKIEGSRQQYSTEPEIGFWIELKQNTLEANIRCSK